MEEVSDILNIRFIHKEEDIIDFNIQNLMPHKLSENGPTLIIGDFNGDGLEDFIVGSSHGFSPSDRLSKNGQYF